jgi:CRP-like cAMP-binding protein
MIETTEIVVTDASEVRELTVDELDEVSGGLPPLTLALTLAIVRVFNSMFD